MKQKLEKAMLDEMAKNPANWKGGVYYFNQNDPRILVPKRSPSIGWTLNLAHKISYGLLLGLLVVIATVIVYIVLR